MEKTEKAKLIHLIWKIESYLKKNLNLDNIRVEEDQIRNRQIVCQINARTESGKKTFSTNPKYLGKSARKREKMTGG